MTLGSGIDVRDLDLDRFVATFCVWFRSVLKPTEWERTLTQEQLVVSTALAARRASTSHRPDPQQATMASFDNHRAAMDFAARHRDGAPPT